jgi:hypothetical protein
MKRSMMTIAMLFFVLMMPLATTSFAATIIVPDNQATIQAGIDAAVNGDTVLVRDGTYLLTAAIDFKGKAITLTSENGAGNCFLDGQNATRVVYFHSGEGNDSVLSGFTIRYGRVTSEPFAGAGIYISSSSPSITDCRISENTVLNANATLPVTAYGGGIYSNASSVKIRNCTIQGNRAEATTNSGLETLSRGGGIYINGGSPSVSDCVIIGNTVSVTTNNVTPSGYSLGGGIYSEGSSPSISNNSISSNTAVGSAVSRKRGGGMYFSTSVPSVVNTTVNGNSANEGGGVYFSQSSAFSNFTNSTIVRNTASTNGGGLYCENSSPTVINSILWEDSPQEVYNDATSSPTITYSDVYGGYTGTGNINASPAFVSIATQDFHLTAGSQCINTGSNAAPYLPLQDKDGNARVNGIVDMGVYEYSGTTLLLHGGRFTVHVNWLTPTGSSGEGTAVALTDDSGYFWFFENTNVELLVKVHNGCGVNGNYWFFYGALTDVAYTITVTDTQTNEVNTYTGFQHIQTSSNDTNAFACP